MSDRENLEPTSSPKDVMRILVISSPEWVGFGCLKSLDRSIAPADTKCHFPKESSVSISMAPELDGVDCHSMLRMVI